MSINSAKKAIIRHRREWVAQLRLRGATQRAIVQKLVEEGVVDTSGRPFSLATINADLQILEREWREHAAADIAALKGRAFAELREVSRVAWENSELSIVLRALAEEIKLFALQGHPLSIAGPTLKRPAPDEETVASFTEQISAAMASASDEQRAALAEKMELLLDDVHSIIAGTQGTAQKIR